MVQYDSKETPRIKACASKALTLTEKKYPHTQKEALAVVWGIERFSFYLIGQSFVVRTDAEANQLIFNGLHRIGKRATTRAESWALRLQPYNFKMERVAGEDNAADALSRLIQETQNAEPFEDDNTGHFLYALDACSMEITWEDIERHAENNKELQGVIKSLESGYWSPMLKKYESQRNSLHCLGNMLFKDDKIVLPDSLRLKAMKSAHGGHIGEVALKRVLREYFWWPGLAQAAEKFVKGCNTCNLLSKKNPPVPLCSRNLPDGPWEILQIDFLSLPNCGSGEFLVTVDTDSRYLSVVEMRSKDTQSTNTALCEIFKTWGLPRIIQSDNGPPFQGSPFCDYWEDKGIKVRKSIPLSPQSNGAVERQNQAMIKAVAASKVEGLNWRTSLEKYVHNHNTLIPHARLKVTPFELMVGWKYRGTFPVLWSRTVDKPLDRIDIREKDSESKLSSKIYADTSRGAKLSDINVGDKVLMAQNKKNKTDTTFSPEYYRVIARNGKKVAVMSSNGVQYSRNIQDLKKIEINTPEPDDNPNVNTNIDLPDDTSTLESDISMQQPKTTATSSLRSRERIRKPQRFDDNYIYVVFH
ncbi:uncharacterized protein K02A2.6-like [Uranotaenia lowii]|uniref:uncharacterized protein K02A2.6-like n=1 Tax=Uranotaenia lowii TaxID=190385 RepID=UPI0024788BDF|nr:uncharacterized protein K02A2.6-like [Uranotaenia lowii]